MAYSATGDLCIDGQGMTPRGVEGVGESKSIFENLIFERLAAKFLLKFPGGSPRVKNG